MNCLLFVVLGLSLVSAYPDGAPLASCVNLLPDHGVPEQSSPSPYVLVAYNNGDGTYQVAIEKSNASAQNFDGYILQARAVDSTVPVGHFENLPANAHTLDCSAPADTITHSDNTPIPTNSFRWVPDGPVNGIAFYGTVALRLTVHWAGLVTQDLGTLP